MTQYGEYLRAQRVYIGLTQSALGRVINMDRRTIQRIENGSEQAGDELRAKMTELVEQFDREVDETIDAAERMGAIDTDNAAIMGVEAKAIHINICTDDDAEAVWTRAVIGRAAVDSGLIVPECRPPELVESHIPDGSVDLAAIQVGRQ